MLTPRGRKKASLVEKGKKVYTQRRGRAHATQTSYLFEIMPMFVYFSPFAFEFNSKINHLENASRNHSKSRQGFCSIRLLCSIKMFIYKIQPFN